MFGRLLLLFTIVPLLELFLLLRIGGAIGVLPTVAIVVVTGVLGAWLARREGLRAWGAVTSELAAGRVPATELMHGFLVLVAGILLVTPGVLTDALGFALLARPFRRRVLRWLRKRFTGGIEVSGVEVGTIAPGGFWPGASGRQAKGDTPEAHRKAAGPRRDDANHRDRPRGRIIDL